MTSFIEQTGGSNPLNGTDVGSFSTPTLGDIDGDGDLDLVVGDVGGNLRYYRNTGTAIAPAFALQGGAANPFNGINVGEKSAPILADLDGDGDLDLVSGATFGTLVYYRNTGTATAPAYAVQTGAANPFDGLRPGHTSSPALGDMDGDGDLDLVIGTGNGSFFYYLNTGTATTPGYVVQFGATNPFNVNATVYNTPRLGDVDGDGDLDLVVGEGVRRLQYHLNTGTATAPAFAAQGGADNPFSGLVVTYNSAIGFGDTDGDGDLDLIVGEEGGTLLSFQNQAVVTPPVYAETVPAANPFSGIDVGEFSAPSLGDIDGDGDLDLVLGVGRGVLLDYRNTGTATAPAYAEQTGTANPFGAVAVGSSSAPSLGDIDGDGDLDLVVGETFGTLKYYLNTGTATAPAYAAQTGPANPFDGLVTGQFSTPSLGDIDGDGDLDLVVGQDRPGVLNLYRNTGTATAPAYARQTGTANPFNGIDVGSGCAPRLGDVDGDGDLDLVVGETSGSLKYYRNTGTATAPAYAEQTGAANPFNGFDAIFYSAPSLADIDHDGDLDLVLGRQDGTLRTFIHNDAPTLRQAAFNLSGIDEDTTGTPVTVASLLASAGWADGDAGAQRGLAITGSTGAGWQYSVGGSTWTPVGAVSDASALLLDAGTQVRYRPDGRNGETASFSFRAWDKTSGTASTDGSPGTADAGSHGGGTAFSATSSTASLQVSAVNDAPTLVATTASLPDIDEETTSMTVQVGFLLNTANWADVDSGALKGIAITSAAGAGSWEYSTGGSVWTPVGPVDTGAALLLALGASLRFVPDGQNGSNALLFYRAWDQTVGSASTDGVRQTADAGTTGGSSAFSVSLNQVRVTVTPVNDAPTTSQVTLGPIAEDSGGLLITQDMLLANAADVDVPAQTLVASNLQITGGGQLLSHSNGTWTFTPALNDDTGVSFSYTIGDGTATVPGSATLDILPANDPPVAVADSAQASAVGAAVNIAVLANDSDVDGGPLTVSAITQGSSGSVSIRPDGVSVRYVPNPGFSGFDTFTYTANDGAGGTAVGTVRVLTPSYVGTSGNDVPLGTPQADFIVSGDGNDRVLAYGGDDFVDGGRGLDTVSGGLGNDTLLGGDGADTFLTTAAELAGDSFDGGDAIDTLQITDPIAVMPAVFTLVNVEQLSFPGSLQVGHTSLLDLSALTLSGTGNQINGGTAASRITGTRSADRITDSAGNDDLRGGEGNDTIMAGVGQDTVYGGRGNDTLGGSSSTLGDGSVDTFVFNTPLNALTNVDTIIGFEANGRDLIALDANIFTALGGSLEADEFRSAIGGNAADGNDFILFDPATGSLYHDADGSGPGARVLFATLGAGLSGVVDAGDFAVGSYPG